MKLAQLFEKDINRKINPAVVAQDKSAETIQTEIDEYVFTDEIINNLYQVLLAIKEKTKVDKTGIWINGYYGSGKSHFLKYVHYCVHPDTREKALERLTDAVKARDRLQNIESRITMDQAEMNDLRRWYASAEIEDMLFNAQDIAGVHRTKNTFTTIFFHIFNQRRGYNSYNIPLAVLLEKYLDEKGAFEKFKKLLELDEGFNWARDAADVVSNELDTVLDIAKRCVPELDVVSLKTNLTNPETYHIDTRRFVKEVQDYIQTKSDNYRLLFLVDEVSQFINNHSDVLLDLQAIIERISIDCNRQVWVACTAQQTIDEVISGVNIQSNSENFGKIMGRFETRVSLESTDAAYITQKRILDKNSDGIKYLQALYQTHHDAIESQFQSGHQLYGGFKTEEVFRLSYPFVPYQFKLISQVFDSFQELEFVVKEVKDNERSVLKITHETAKQTKDWEVGAFIPFDAFFNNMMRQNLIHKGNRALMPALELTEVKTDEFNQRVVKVLFMASHLLDKYKMNFASTLDNLTFLMMKQVDENRMQLRNQIEKTLNLLISNNIIREEKGSYYFYNEDEAELSTLIKNTPASNEFRVNQIAEILFSYLKVENKFRYAGNDFRVTASIDGRQYMGNTGDVQLLFHFYNTTEDDATKISLNNPFNGLSFCFNQFFMHDAAFLETFIQYCKVEKYLSESHYEITATREKSLENFRNRNKDLKKQVIAPKFQDWVQQINFVSGSIVIEANEVNGNSAERYKNVLYRHLENVYKYAKLAETLPSNAEELRTRSNQPFNREEYKMKPLSEPERLVNDYIIRQGNEAVLADMISYFGKPPYGWKETAVIYIVTELKKRDLREIKYKRQIVYSIRDFLVYALNTRERDSITLSSMQEISQELINQALQAWTVIFNKPAGSTGDSHVLFDNLKQKLNQYYEEWIVVREKCEGYPFDKPITLLTDKLQKWQTIREPQRFFEALITDKESIGCLIDQCREIREFADIQLSKYKDIRQYCTDNQVNFSSLDDLNTAKAAELKVFFEKDNPVSDFRLIVKIHNELKAAISEKIKTMKADVLEKYQVGFQALSDLIREHDLQASNYPDECTKVEALNRMKDILTLQNAYLKAESYFDEIRRNMLLDIETNKQQKQQDEKRKYIINRTNGDSGLDGQGNSSCSGNPYGAFESDGITVSNDSAKPVDMLQIAEKTIDYVPKKPAKILSTKEDVDEYIEKLRNELMKMIDNNQYIIIK